MRTHTALLFAGLLFIIPLVTAHDTVTQKHQNLYNTEAYAPGTIHRRFSRILRESHADLYTLGYLGIVPLDQHSPTTTRDLDAPRPAFVFYVPKLNTTAKTEEGIPTCISPGSFTYTFLYTEPSEIAAEGFSGVFAKRGKPAPYTVGQDIFLDISIWPGSHANTNHSAIAKTSRVRCRTAQVLPLALSTYNAAVLRVTCPDISSPILGYLDGTNDCRKSVSEGLVIMTEFSRANYYPMGVFSPGTLHGVPLLPDETRDDSIISAMRHISEQHRVTDAAAASKRSSKPSRSNDVLIQAGTSWFNSPVKGAIQLGLPGPNELVFLPTNKVEYVVAYHTSHEVVATPDEAAEDAAKPPTVLIVTAEPPVQMPLGEFGNEEEDEFEEQQQQEQENNTSSAVEDKEEEEEVIVSSSPSSPVESPASPPELIFRKSEGDESTGDTTDSSSSSSSNTHQALSYSAIATSVGTVTVGIVYAVRLFRKKRRHKRNAESQSAAIYEPPTTETHTVSLFEEGEML